MDAKATPRDWAIRAVIYVLLSLFALMMLFPFIYMMATSFKNSGDVFHYPPRVLPYSANTMDYNGEQVPVYRFEVNGQTRDLVLTGDKEPFGFFTTEALINAAEPRQSEILTQAALDEAVELGETATIDGEDFDVYEVTMDGQSQRLLLAYRSSLDVFAAPEDPSIVEYAIARTAALDESVEFQTDNYNIVFNELDLQRSLVNTTFVTFGVTIGQLVTSIFGGYAFSRIPFKGRDTLFVMYLGSIMIPFVVLIIPMYRLMVVIGWQNRIVALIVPWVFSAYGTFLMRQFFLTIPKEIEEAALLDGCSRLRILWTIFVPLSTPSVATLGIFSFLYAWNSFLWPLLIIGEGNEANHVLTLSLIRLSNIAADRPNLVLTGAAIAILPPILVFILAQRYFIESVASSAVKG